MLNKQKRKTPSSSSASSASSSSSSSSSSCSYVLGFRSTRENQCGKASPFFRSFAVDQKGNLAILFLKLKERKGERERERERESGKGRKAMDEFRIIMGEWSILERPRAYYGKWLASAICIGFVNTSRVVIGTLFKRAKSWEENGFLYEVGQKTTQF